jgi:hypothetical protein
MTMGLEGAKRHLLSAAGWRLAAGGASCFVDYFKCLAFYANPDGWFDAGDFARMEIAELESQPDRAVARFETWYSQTSVELGIGASSQSSAAHYGFRQGKSALAAIAVYRTPMLGLRLRRRVRHAGAVRQLGITKLEKEPR